MANFVLTTAFAKTSLFSSCFLLSSLSAGAATYAVTATSLTMHVGDAPPPLIFSLSSYSGAYASVFTGQPTLSTSAASSSPPGRYPIRIAAGSMRTQNSADNLKFVNGTLTVVPANGIGAKLENGIAYPPGYFSGPAFAMIDVKSNPIAQLAGDCVTDDTQNLQALLAWGRDSRHATVNVSGAAVTATNGISFAGLAGPVQINGVVAVIDSVIDDTHLTLTRPLGTLKGAILRSGGDVVSTSSNGNVVSIVSGPAFTNLAPNGQILVNGIMYRIAFVIDSNHLVTKETLPNQTGVKAYAGPSASAWGRQMLQLYFPAGCYLVSNQLQVYGNYWTLLGDGPQKSYIRLAPNTPAFNNGATKAYLLAVPAVNYNQSFREFIYNLGFNVGPGNPNAEVVHWVVSNMGAMRNVQIWCDDSNCLQGVGLEGAYAGPGLIKNVAIYGSQYGIQASGQNEYFMTLENITTEGQLAMAVSNKNYHFTMRHWLNVNSVPALISTGPLASMAFLDSELICDDAAGVTGMSNASGGSLYGRDVKCSGYEPCEIENGSGTPGIRNTLPTEFWTGNAQTVFDDTQTPSSLHLPERETPDVTDPCTPRSCDWQQLGSDPSTWATTIANAASPSLYLPPGSYDATANVLVTVPDSVNYINLNNAQFSLAHSSIKLYVTVAGSSATPLIIDGCMYNTNCFISHTGRRALVLRDTIAGYQAAPGSGDLYLDDVGLGSYTGVAASDGPTFYRSQHVWARALNMENGRPTDLLYPKFICDGAAMWILGYKTERDSPSVVAQNDCQAEVFGFFFYQLHLNPVPPDASPIHVSDSSVFATGFIFVNGPGFGASNWVNESQAQRSASLPSPSVDTSQHLKMFYSYGGASSKHRKRQEKP
jgi:hypothetical protein